jgi:hypothetical protein
MTVNGIRENKMNSARFTRTVFTHSFTENDVIIQVISPGRITQFLVDEVISPSKLRVLLYDQNGELTARPRIIQDNELINFCKDEVASLLLKTNQSRKSA